MSPRVLLIGGHGKIALLMTPKLLERSWQVTSVIRNPDHEQEIRDASKNQPGSLDVLTSSLDKIKSVDQAQSIIDSAKPDYVIWSAGAGGKGGAESTYAVDRDAAQHFIRASVRTSHVKKFLMISYIASRKTRAPWWTDDDWAAAQKVNNEVLPDYAKAKIAADETLTALSLQREDFQGICLRPGTLTAEPATGKITLGRTSARGEVTRADVAEVGVRLLEQDGVKGRLDLLNGNEAVGDAIQQVLKEGIDCTEGEDVEAMKSTYRL